MSYIDCKSLAKDIYRNKLNNLTKAFRQKMKKKGQGDATAIATLIILIGLFILGYVLLLQPADREALLGETSSSSGLLDDDDRDVSGLTLLSESPGKVYSSDQKEFVFKLNPVKLQTTSEEKLINLADSLTIAKGVFDEDSETLLFKLDNPLNIEKLDLFFFIRKGRGKLVVSLNSHTVFEGEATSNDVPINLPSNYLRKSNVLKISAVSTGLLSGSYELANVYLKETKTSDNKKQSRTFELTSSEKSGLKRATLYYFINCYQVKDQKQGELSIYLNDNLATIDNIFCDAGPQTQTLSKSRILAGTNRLSFEVDTGDYSIEGMEIAFETSEKLYPRYNFEVDDDVYDDVVEDRTDEAYIKLKFDDETRKKATITINDDQIAFDTHDLTYKRKVSGFLRRGSNSIKIIPHTDLDIEDLRIYVEDK